MGRYSASGSQPDLKKPLSSIRIRRCSAKKGIVSAKSITARGLILEPSKYAVFIVSSGAASACFSLFLYCCFK